MYFDKLLNTSERIKALANCDYSEEATEILRVLDEEIKNLTEDSISEAGRKDSDKDKIYCNLVKVGAYRDILKLINNAKEKMKEVYE